MKNFMSYEDAEINFDKSGYTIVQGVNLNKDDNAASNGAGKSTCFEAIVWALTGETIRGTSDVKRFGSADKCEVELVFSIDDTNYKVIRTKDPSNLFIYVNDENKSGKGIRDTSALLKEYLPDLTAQLIGSVVIMGQGLPMRFSNNSPSGRKDVLEKLSKSDFMIEDLKSKVLNRKTELNSSKRKLEDLILANTTIINTKTNEVKRFTAELETLNTIDYDTTINDKTALINANTTNRDNIKAQIDKKQEGLNTLLAEQTTTTNDKYAQLQVANDKYQPLIDEQTKLRTAEEGKRASLKHDITNIKNIKTHCPTCGQELKGVEKPDPQPLIDELAIVEAKITEIQRIITEYIASNAVERQQIVDIFKEISDKQAISIAAFKKDIQDLNYNYIEYNRLIDVAMGELNDAKLKKQNHAYKVEQLNQAITDANTQIGVATKTNSESTAELDNIKLHLDVINKFEGALKRDFRGILLNNIIKYIDLRAKEYSNIVFGTDKIGFELDGNNISITYDGKDYTNLSGGERAKVDIIIQFALRSMLCKYLNFSSNILVIDEIFDNLDMTGCQNVLTLIAKKLEDVDSIYIISHHTDLAIPFDHTITIIKNNNISTIQ